VDRPGQDTPIRLNASITQLAGVGLFVLVSTAVFTVWLGPFMGILVLLLGLLSLVRDACGIDLDSTGVRFWGFLRPRSLTWAQVRELETNGNRIHLGTRTAVHVLGAPRRGIVLSDPAFDRKYAFLRQTWERHRATADSRVS
jgi:hypothetical protein